MTNVTDLIRQDQGIDSAWSPQDFCWEEEGRDMVNLVFTGTAGEDPAFHSTDTGNSIAVFPVDVKEQPHLPATRILVVAIGRQAVYVQESIRQGSLVLVSGWFYLAKNKDGNEFVQVKARHVRALVTRVCR